MVVTSTVPFSLTRVILFVYIKTSKIINYNLYTLVDNTIVFLSLSLLHTHTSNNCKTFKIKEEEIK